MTLREQHQAYPEFLEPEALPAPLVASDLFGVEAPLEVEVGCGNGRYISRAATMRPDHLFLGIERSLSYARKARDRMKKYNVGTARIVKADASRFLASHFGENSIHALHVYFTDPWPKKKHARRRLFQTPFLQTLHRILPPGGVVHIKIDLLWYFGEIFGRFETSPLFDVVTCGSETDRRREHAEITGFEQKALQNKGIVYYLTCRNRS